MDEERKFPDYEQKWQAKWDTTREKASEATTPKGADNFYILSMFPYPSGKLHFGHALPYTLTDSMARYLRMNGKNVLNPTGWDAFGLPAENAAIEQKSHPSKFTYENIAEMRKQQHAFGYSFDWERELFTCKPDYYKWTQWIFLQMLEKGVAYRKTARVNWCTKCNTVLANEQVQTLIKDGEEFQACERCESRVIPKEIPAWYLRITDYADRLLEGLDKLGDDWPERVTSQQRYWIGRSQGVNIDFTAKLGKSEPLTVFTTRADTVFGVTYVALAPEHPLVEQIIEQSDAKKAKQLREFVKEVLTMTEQDRAGGAEKEGIDTSFKAVNPLNGEEVPIFVANYVLMYGTGAVMAVPAHDERDHEFAQEYKLPIKQVIQPTASGKQEAGARSASEGAVKSIEEEAFTEHGKLINSGKYDGLSTPEAIAKIAADLAAEGKGGEKVNYKLRDWGISRQRYWGCPIPVIHCPDCGIVPVPESDLPVQLPDDVDFLPTGQSPLTLHPNFQHVKCPKCGGDAKRDTDTMDTFVDSSWYFLRYTDPHNDAEIFDKAKCAHWAPVDLYIGGREHAILHLIYARFYTKFLHDIGLINFDEPFKRLYAHGLIQGESIRVVNEHMNRYVSPDEFAKLKKDGKAGDGDITRRIEKMSKSKKNGADPTALMAQYGADAVRLAILFLGPGDADSVWDANGMKGPYGFLRRWYDTVLQYAPKVEDLGELPPGLEFSPAAKALRAASHSLIDKVTREFEGRYAFNTAIAQGMALLNDISTFAKAGVEDDASRYALREAFEAMVLTLSPFVPHTAEELNEALGHKESVFSRPWPKADKQAMQLDEVEIPVQVNGKVRGTIMLPREADKATMEKLAMDNDNVQKFVDGKQIVKLIAVPGRIVNIVAK
ncbi:MAG: leucine--tRNA ligase [Planctomycetes bacterium]|nr:leucine--tRNA ligase [Planctomycetota bacterium]